MQSFSSRRKELRTKTRRGETAGPATPGAVPSLPRCSGPDLEVLGCLARLAARLTNEAALPFRFRGLSEHPGDALPTSFKAPPLPICLVLPLRRLARASTTNCESSVMGTLLRLKRPSAGASAVGVAMPSSWVSSTTRLGMAVDTSSAESTAGPAVTSIGNSASDRPGRRAARRSGVSGISSSGDHSPSVPQLVSALSAPSCVSGTSTGGVSATTAAAAAPLAAGGVRLARLTPHRPLAMGRLPEPVRESWCCWCCWCCSTDS
mmetsp:Transcript_8704/g.22523  ORF Transcript_8704/g.22523 Transcript_8704/m.22523 type:complete len:263 (+) Transcript_8704:611-1399(+)